MKERLKLYHFLIGGLLVGVGIAAIIAYLCERK